MENEKDNFTYSYTAPTRSQRREIEDIRREYAVKTENEQGDKMERLRALDKKVKDVPVALALTMGIIGILLFGGGMALCLKLYEYVGGVILSILGIALLAPAYFVYKTLLKVRKEKYGPQILALSEELLAEQKANDE